MAAAVHSVEGLHLEWVSSTHDVPLLFVVRPTVRQNGTGRLRAHEVIVARPDVASVVAWGHNDVGGVDVVLIHEFRVGANNPGGRLCELPAGSSETWREDTDDDWVRTAHDELVEETGLDVAIERLISRGARQLSGGLSIHRTHIFSVELTAAELEQVRTNPGPFGAGAIEACYPTLRTWPCADVDIDAATLGIIAVVAATW